MQQQITPHLWFDKEAKEAVEFYTSVFPNSKMTHAATIHDVPTPTGDTDIISFELSSHPFMAINAGPLFTFNPSVSFIVNFDPSRDKDARKNLDTMWDKLSQGGTALMPLQQYPFSERYGWVQDKYGLSWQLMFTGNVAGRAEEAINFYLSIFKNSKMGQVHRYRAGQEPDKEGTVMFADFKLLNTWLAAMDSAREHQFTFNEATSLLIPCETQEEIDYYWEK